MPETTYAEVPEQIQPRMEVPPRASGVTLYALTEEMVEIGAVLELLGDVSPEDADYTEALIVLRGKLDALTGDRTAKLEACAAVWRNCEAESAACKTEAKRFSDRQRAAENRAKWLKDYMKFCMESAGENRVDAGRFKLSVCANGGKAPVEITGVDALPEKYVVMIPQPRTDDIRAALESGEIVPGAELRERGTHLRIK